MATAIEAMGLTLPGSSSYPALSPEKARECERAAEVIKTTMAKDIRPRDLLTRAAFENALVITMILGGSTNGVLHFLAMANTAEVPLTLDDVDRVSNRTPFLADLAPSGRYLMEDLYKIGGTPSVLKMLIAAGRINGDIPTVTGRTLAENVADWPSLPPEQTIIRSLSDPIKETGHIRVLRGNLAPEGAVAKITGKEGLRFEGRARVFNKEHELDDALSRGEIPRDENLVLIVRYEGPKGGPGMPEQLKASAAIIGAGLKNIALVTDGRYSGASHGFIVSLALLVISVFLSLSATHTSTFSLIHTHLAWSFTREHESPNAQYKPLYPIPRSNSISLSVHPIHTTKDTRRTNPGPNHTRSDT